MNVEDKWSKRLAAYNNYITKANEIKRVNKLITKTQGFANTVNQLAKANKFITAL